MMKGSAGSTLGIENGICIEIKNRVWEERRPFMAYIEFNNVTKEYKTGETSIKALDGASFSVEKGELAVILGSSGAGKTTALNILGGMDVPTAGGIKVDGRDIAKYNKKQLVGYRRTDIGFVFQFYNLVQNLTALENVELASEICRDPLDPAATLESVGLGERLNNFPAQLSGGEQAFVAIALFFAILQVNPTPFCILDEIEAALDEVNVERLAEYIKRYSDGTQFIMITHRRGTMNAADRIYGITMPEHGISNVFELDVAEISKQKGSKWDGLFE